MRGMASAAEQNTETQAQKNFAVAMELRDVLAPLPLCVGIDILAIRLMFATSLAANIENKY